jgi:4-methylaminobutanoate oxidase (formaldehyde-forming)
VHELPPRARVVIVGGGIIGSSIAYHLTRAGETDVVMLERGHLTNGTTWHAAGLVSQVRGTRALTELTRHNAETYERLPGETGIETGLRRVGALTVARTEGRMQEILYGVGMARDAGIPVEVLPPAQVKDLWPGAVVDDLVGAVLFPTDGTVNPGDAALSFAKGAVDAGRALRAGHRGGRLRVRRRPRDRAWRRRAGRSRRRRSCSRAGCGRASWRGAQARACRCTRPSTSG